MPAAGWASPSAVPSLPDLLLSGALLLFFYGKFCKGVSKLAKALFSYCCEHLQLISNASYVNLLRAPVPVWRSLRQAQGSGPAVRHVRN